MFAYLNLFLSMSKLHDFGGPEHGKMSLIQSY